ncbi:hypothetical protein BJY01DRAFT_258009 [Aspergillus pseudoustus]|uniref:Aminoglycoside phosphotransferase domain-containing protein n=1 Tax=Aspergillus pseudoustus TaxID=1810923 RepID=A0ABR4JG43_9EURO
MEVNHAVVTTGENTPSDNPPTEASRNDPTNDPPPLKPHKALLRGFITLSDAEEEEEDMRPRLIYAQQRGEFYEELKARSSEIQSVVASHCGLTNPDLVHLSPMYNEKRIFWQHGSFNVCIPVTIEQSEKSQSLSSKMAFRVPLPYKVGEHHYPGNCEEKLRSEAATYIWINKNCPEVPTATLRGFGVPGGTSFFEPRSRTLWQRCKWSVWRLLQSLYGRTGFCDYIPQTRTIFTGHGYMLIDWIDNKDEQVLSNVFRTPHTDDQTQNLYQSMAKIIVSLARIPQPRIGSWTISDDGRLSLSNRPLLCHFQQLENLNIASGVARGTTYTSADTFCLDLLDGHDNRLRYQANAAFDENDARNQAVDLVFMRSTLSQFTDRSLRDGPFVMNLTDMHISNIFVDKDWNIKHIIDLEWACSLPLEHALIPEWLTDKGVDQLVDLEYEKFEKHYRLLTAAVRQQEAGAPIHYNGSTYSLAATMDRGFDDCHYWYLMALQTPKGLFNVSRSHLQPLYDKVPGDSLCAAVSPLWTPGMSSFVNMKLKDYADYIQQVREIFNSPQSGKIYMR